MAGLQPISRDSFDFEGLAAMLDKQTNEASETSFVTCHQTWLRSRQLQTGNSG